MSWYDVGCIVDGLNQLAKAGKPDAPTDEEDEALRLKHG